MLAELGAGKGLISVSGDHAYARRLVATLANEVASGRWGPETTVVAAELSADELDLDQPRLRILRDVRDVPTAANGPLEQEFGALAIMLGRPPDLATGRRLARDAVASAGRVVVVVAGSVPDAHRRWWVSSDGWLHAEGNEFRLDFLDAGGRAGNALRSGRR